MLTLIQEDILYKKVITQTSSGSYVNGIWISGESVVTYEEVEGITEPYVKSEQSVVLPEGVSNTDALILFSPDSTLKTYQSLVGSNQLADVLTLEDPLVNPNTSAYVVWDRMPWKKNSGFTLIEDFGEYILIREDRI